MTSSNGNIFRITGPLCAELTRHRWIPRTKASDVELWSFLWSAPWINGWVNYHKPGDLRCHRAHYDVIVMSWFHLWVPHLQMSGSDMINTLRPRQDGRHFPDDIFICIFLKENEWHSIKISLKFVPMVPINNIPALVQIMAWRQPGDKPLSELMMAVLPTHICVTRPQWVK